jgi:hypothetical protein
MRRVSKSGWRAEFSQNLFPIAFSRNAASEMEKRDDRVSPARPIVGSHDDRLSNVSRAASRCAIGSSCRIRTFASLQGNGDIWSTAAESPIAASWDIPAFPARPFQRQVYRRNPTFSELSTGQK